METKQRQQQQNKNKLHYDGYATLKCSLTPDNRIGGNPDPDIEKTRSTMRYIYRIPIISRTHTRNIRSLCHTDCFLLCSSGAGAVRQP